MYHVMPSARLAGCFDICQIGHERFPAETVRSQGAAHTYCRALNANNARINPGRLLGCRVEITALSSVDPREILRARLAESSMPARLVA